MMRAQPLVLHLDDDLTHQADVVCLQVPDDDADMDGEEMEQLHEEIEADYDAGDTIKSKLIPHAVAW
jgi:hypothetical protein